MTATATHRAYVGLGANLGDACATVRAAIERLRPLGLLAASSLYASAPIDAEGPPYVNAVTALDSPLSAPELLAALHAVEIEFGRQRPFRHAPRTLDLDLLLHGHTACASPTLTLPHPRLHERAFVLVPLLELAPQLHAPGLGVLAAYLPSVAAQVVERLPGPPTMRPC